MSPSLRGPSTAAERILAPDLARGAMLLLIALANTPWYLWATQPGPFSMHPEDGSVVDRVVQAVIMIVVDFRTYPMFAFLFGYGIVQLYQRQLAGGTSDLDARRLLRRRHWWMLAFGLVHAALLWEGDVIGVYGLAGLLLVWLFFRRTDRTLRIWLIVLVSLMIISMILAIVSAVFFHPYIPAQGSGSFLAGSRGPIAETSYPASIVERVSFWPLLLIFQGIGTLVVPIVILIAFLAGRHRVLEQPERHLRLLRRTAVVCIGIGWLGGIPTVLQHFGVVTIPLQVSWVTFSVQSATGAFAGVGYVAVFGLLSHWLRTRQADQTRVVQALQAVGKRSLSCYLAQSVLCAPLLAAWGLGLGARLSSWSMALFAIAVWGLTVALAWLMERRAWRGPAEVLLRWLSYRAAARPTPIQVSS